MEDLKKKVEALLFSSGRKMSLDELSKLCRKSPDSIKDALNELKNDYSDKKSSLMIVDEGEFWKLTTKEAYLQLVKNIVTKTELSKTLMETLAVIAFKYPIKQADLIKIRTNKAYDHLKELEEMGYITRQKYGRTKLIKLSEKFFDYFSLPEDKLKEQFNDFEGLAGAIESKEEEIKKLNAEQKKKAKAAKEVDLIDKEGNMVKLDVVDEPAEEEKKVEEKAGVEVYENNLNGLEVTDIEEKPMEEEKSEEETENDLGEEAKGITLDDVDDNEVDERVSEILGLKPEVNESGKNNKPDEVLENEVEEEGMAEVKEPTEEPTIDEEGQESENQANEEGSEEKKQNISAVDERVDALLNPPEDKPKELREIDESKWGQEEKKDPLLGNNIPKKKDRKYNGDGL